MQPDKWSKWIRRFERFREAYGLDKKVQGNQVNTFLYCMGDKAENILCSLNPTADEKILQHSEMKVGRTLHQMQKPEF